MILNNKKLISYLQEYVTPEEYTTNPKLRELTDKIIVPSLKLTCIDFSSLSLEDISLLRMNAKKLSEQNAFYNNVRDCLRKLSRQVVEVDFI